MTTGNTAAPAWNGSIAELDAAEVIAATGAASVAFLGRGSYGETWRVERGHDSVSAVKFILHSAYPQQILDREIAGLRRVSDPRVVRLLDCTIVTLSRGDRPALEFEYVDGRDVARHLDSGDWPSLIDAEHFVRSLLGAVAALHATETVHRDIKPANIALRRDAWSQPVLLDLGLAKQLDVETLTVYPTLKGTVPFMAPEQLRGESSRKQADVWAAGAVAHLVLAHEHPFLDASEAQVLPEELLKRIESGPRAMPVQVPAHLQVLVWRLLSFEPHERGSARRALREMEERDGAQPD